MVSKKVKRTLLVTGIVIVSFIAVVIIFFSPIAKYLIEKYDVKFLGREVKTGFCYANPLTGYIHLGNLRLYELHSNKVFISAAFSLDFNMWKLLKKEYEIESLTLNHTKMHVIQQRDRFNFNDIIDKFTPKEKKIVKKARTKFSILDIRIKNSEIHYHEKVIPIVYFIKDVNISSPGMWWNRDTMAVKFAFKNGPSSGDVKGDITINLNTKDYRLNLNIKKFDLGILEQYVHDMANYGSFRAFLDADFHSKSNFKSILEMTAKGWLNIYDFHFGKNKKEDFASFESLILAFRELNPKQYRYYLDSVTMTHPYFKYEIYDYLNNLERMFGAGGSKVKEAHADSTKFNPLFEIAKSVQQIAVNFWESYYKVDRLAIYRGEVWFNDFSPREKFSLGLKPFYITADSIDKNHRRMLIRMNSDIQPYGKLTANLALDPKDNRTFEMNYKIERLSVPVLNPYLITYTSFPLDRGSLDFTGYFNPDKGIIDSKNHLVILDPRVGKRIRKKDTKWIPVPLIMAFVRERGNVIDYEIPISGDLNDPKMHYKDIILDLLKNIFVKPPTTPYAFTVRNVENEIEKSLTLVWEMRQTKLRNGQERFLDKIADFLKKTPEATISVKPYMYADKEKEYILFYEAKKKFFLMMNKKSTLSEEDSAYVEKMSVKDSGFVHYLTKRYGDDIYTVQQKCALFVGENLVNAKFAQLLKDRERVFMQYFKDNGTDGRVTLLENENKVPFNGFSYFKISYKGEIPKSLREAYDKLDELNEEGPRKRYEEERKKNKSTAPVPVP
jgi:hypothetical protein